MTSALMLSGSFNISSSKIAFTSRSVKSHKYPGVRTGSSGSKSHMTNNLFFSMIAQRLFSSLDHITDQTSFFS